MENMRNMGTGYNIAYKPRNKTMKSNDETIKMAKCGENW